MGFDEVIVNLKPPVEDIQYLQITFIIGQGRWPKLRELIQVFRLSGELIWTKGYALLDNLVECGDYTLVDILVRLFFSLRPLVGINNEFPVLHFVFYYAILIKNVPLLDKLLTVAGVSVNDPLNGESPLCCAIRTKAGLGTIKFIIDQGARVNETDIRVDLSPLGLVIGYQASNFDLAELLLSHGADVNQTYPESVTMTLVNLACEASNNEGLIWLLSHKADPNVQTKCGQTALHTAVALGNLSNVRTLLEFGASIDTLNRVGQTPLMIAVETNNAEIAELLLQCGAKFHNTTLNDAFKKNITANINNPSYISAQKKIFNILKEHGFVVINININDKAFFHAAARQGHVWIIKAFLEAGGSPNSEFVSNPLLYDAVMSRNKDLVELLLAYEPDTNCKEKNTRSALLASVSSNQVEITELLLSKGHTGPSYCCVLNAVDNLNMDMLKVLFKFGITNLNNSGGQYLSPIHFAILSEKAASRLTEDIDLEKAELVRFLLNHGASVAPQHNLGPKRNPIHLAIQQDYVQVVKVLLEAGASFDDCVQVEANLLPSTILHFAVIYNSKEMVKVLLEKGASVDALQFDGKTPLRIAVESNAPKAVNELLKFGADVDNRRNGNETALHVACLLGNGDVTAVLLDHGADINAGDSMGLTPFMQFKKTLLAMRIVAQEIWCVYEHGEAIAGPKSPLYHLQRHAFKMNFVGLPLHPCYKSALELEYSKEFISSCMKELEAMKTFEIGSNYLHVYDVIKQKQDPVYVSNKSVLLNLDGNDLWENFTLYRGVFKRCVKTAKLRNELLNSGQKHLFDVLRFSCLNDLPEEVVRKILSYLKDEELQILQTV